MSLSVPILYGNAFFAVSEESIYNFPLDLGLSIKALAAEAPVTRACRHCISAAGIASYLGIDAQASTIPIIPDIVSSVM